MSSIGGTEANYLGCDICYAQIKNGQTYSVNYRKKENYHLKCRRANLICELCKKNLLESSYIFNHISGKHYHLSCQDRLICQGKIKKEEKKEKKKAEEIETDEEMQAALEVCEIFSEYKLNSGVEFMMQ